MHYSVMLGEALEYLAIRPDGIYLDATSGLGGHTAAIAARLTTGRLISADRDAESLAMARQNAAQHAARIEFVQACFSELPARLKELGVEKVDGLLADLGVSRYQLMEPERGFSLMADGPLDMRMSRTEGTTTAADILNFSSEKEIADLIFRLGEEGGSRRVARAIVRARPIRSTAQLAQLIEKAVPRTGKLHPATRTFMALRQAVNDEPGELTTLLRDAPGLVARRGRVVIITFMSLEDRMVKQAFQEWKRTGVADVLTKHVIKPSEVEVAENPPSRSAKLRAAEIV
jgi:16S rRNA (cytosine1402-N4)-methyltransferase